MKTMTIWPGAIVDVGENIEIRVFTTNTGLWKLGIAAPEDLRISRRGGSRPPGLHHRRRAQRLKNQVSTRRKPLE